MSSSTISPSTQGILALGEERTVLILLSGKIEFTLGKFTLFRNLIAGYLKFSPVAFLISLLIIGGI